MERLPPHTGVTAASRALSSRFSASVPTAVGERGRANASSWELQPRQQKDVEVGSFSADFNATSRPGRCLLVDGFLVLEVGSTSADFTGSQAQVILSPTLLVFLNILMQMQMFLVL